MHLVNALNWHYTEEDVGWIAELNLLRKLVKGNGLVLAAHGALNMPNQINHSAEADLELPFYVW